METTPYPHYIPLSQGSSYTVKKGHSIAVVLSLNASAGWVAQNGTTGKISTSMVLGRYTQPITITAVGGDVELILNGDVQLAGPDEDGGKEYLEANLEDFSEVMENIIREAIGSNELIYSTPNGNAPRVLNVNNAGNITGDFIFNLGLLGSFSIYDGLFSPVTRTLGEYSIRGKMA